MNFSEFNLCIFLTKIFYNQKLSVKQDWDCKSYIYHFVNLQKGLEYDSSVSFTYFIKIAV